MSAAELYAAMCDYLIANGWHRLDEPPVEAEWVQTDWGHRWTLGDAVTASLKSDGVDTRSRAENGQPRGAAGDA